MSTYQLDTDVAATASRKSDTPKPQKQENLTNFEDALDVLLRDMKTHDGLDQSRLATVDRLHETLGKCQIQEDVERDELDRKVTEDENDIAKLIEISETLCENIKVDRELFEQQRIKMDNELLTQLESNMNDSSKETLAEFDSIWAKWTELGQLENHRELEPKFEALKADVAQLMEKKKQVVAQTQQQYARLTEVLGESLEKDELNLILLIQRVEAAADLVNKVYRQKAEQFESSIHEKALKLSEEKIEGMQKEWDEMLAKGEEFNDIMMKKHKSYEDKLEAITKEEAEATRMIIVRLEDEFLKLQSDIEMQKKQMLINSEKNDYNLQILDKRNYEQITISNLQKRRVARLNHRYQELKKKSESLAAEHTKKEKKLVEEVQNLKKSVPELERKLRQTRLRNKNKFDKLWNMNFNEITELTKKIMDADKTICTVLLQQEWQPPALDFTDINPLNSQPRLKSKYKNATAKKLPSTEDEDDEKRIMAEFLRNILQQISDRGGIFLEHEVTDVLSAYDAKNQQLVRLDHVLKALNLNNENLLNKLRNFFLPYTWCPNCMDGLPDEMVKRLLNMPTDGTTERVEERKILEKCDDHHLVTERAFVLTIINQFACQMGVKDMKNVKPNGTASLTDKSTNLDKFDDKTINEFFSKFLQYAQGDELKHWKLLEHGFTHYLDSLRKREALFEENRQLRKENMELSHFLKNMPQE